MAYPLLTKKLTVLGEIVYVSIFLLSNRQSLMKYFNVLHALSSVNTFPSKPNNLHSDTANFFIVNV